MKMALTHLIETTRKVQDYLPYPRVWAAITGVPVPANSMVGQKSNLIRPEGIAFTQTGHLMAVSNSEGNSVTVYKRREGVRTGYHSKPCWKVVDPDDLNYVHDVAFSPCGRLLGAAARDAQSVVIFGQSEGPAATFDTKPRLTMKGPECQLGDPTAISFHPSGDWFAVANRKGGSGITLYSSPTGHRGRTFTPAPFQSITETELLTHNLAAPHGLAFSQDGRWLVVTHKRFFKTHSPEGISGISIFTCKKQTDIGLQPHPCSIFSYEQACVHSAAFHPDGEVLAVTNEAADVDILRWNAEKNSFQRIGIIPILRGTMKEGPKGISFTSDGQQLAVTTALNQVLFYSKWENGAQGKGNLCEPGDSKACYKFAEATIGEQR